MREIFFTVLMMIVMTIIGQSKLFYADAQTDISQAEFMDIFERQFKKSAPEKCITPLPDGEFGFHIGGGPEKCNETQIFLINLYTDYQREETAQVRREVIAQFIDAFTTLDVDDFGSIDRALLVVQLRSVAYTDYINSLDSKTAYVVRRFQGDLDAVLMQDGDRALSPVSRSELDQLGIDEDRAFAIAQENLARLVGEIYEQNLEGLPGLRLVSSQNSLTSGLLYQPDACKKGSSNKAYLIFHRYQYISAGLEDEATLELMLNVFDGLTSEGESMSETLLTCMDGQWAVILKEGSPVLE